jgi:hypothetical protein
MKPELDAWHINIGKCHNQQSRSVEKTKSSEKIKSGYHKLENVTSVASKSCER